jgi:hypothetical protein
VGRSAGASLGAGRRGIAAQSIRELHDLGDDVSGPARTINGLAEGVVKRRRTLGTTFQRLVDAGFAVDRLVEFRPTAEQIAANPEMAEEVERPTFLLMRAGR